MSYWHLHPDVIAWIAVIQFGYLVALGEIGRRCGLRATRGQLAWFTGGVAVLFIAAGTPIHDIAEQRLFMVHMIQHMLLTLVAPPMLLLGTPRWLAEGLLGAGRRLRIVRIFAKPFLAFVIFNAVTLFTHLPVSVDATLNYHWLHFFAHVLLIVTATLMWVAVLSPTPALPRLAPPVQLIYLFLQSLVPSVLASFITFATEPLYEFYTRVPRMWGFSPVLDQRVAGLIMKLAGGAILWTVMGIVFFLWVAREERRSKPTALRWEDVEEELGRMGLTESGTSQSR